MSTKHLYKEANYQMAVNYG